MTKKWVKAFAPATIANVGPGFDVFGLALKKPGDEVWARLKSGKGITIKQITGDGGRLPTDPDKNSAAIAAERVMHILGIEKGLELIIHKKMPLSSGLGSSAASAVAGAMAANKALEGDLTKEELLPACLAAEAVVSVAHIDNVGASMLGGFVIVEGTNPISVHKIHTLPELFVALITPDKEVPTRTARHILPEQIRLMDAVRQWSKVAVMVHAIYEGNADLFARSIDDQIIEPRRARLIPKFKKLKEAAFMAGAIGFSISGAAPTVFAMCTDPRVAKRVAEAMKRVYDQAGINSQALTTRPDLYGARILK